MDFFYNSLIKYVVDDFLSGKYYNLCTAQSMTLEEINNKNIRYSNKCNICWDKEKYSNKDIKEIKNNILKRFNKEIKMNRSD